MRLPVLQINVGKMVHRAGSKRRSLLDLLRFDLFYSNCEINDTILVRARRKWNLGEMLYFCIYKKIKIGLSYLLMTK